jgi:alpha-L-rhamnosidase
VRPQPGGGLTSARAELVTQYGPAASGWTLEGDQFHLRVRVPPNTRATVWLPGATFAQVTESGRAVASASGVTGVSQEPGAVVVDVGSGDYDFVYPAASFATRKHVD